MPATPTSVAGVAGNGTAPERLRRPRVAIAADVRRPWPDRGARSASVSRTEPSGMLVSKSDARRRSRARSRSSRRRCRRRRALRRARPGTTRRPRETSAPLRARRRSPRPGSPGSRRPGPGTSAALARAPQRLGADGGDVGVVARARWRRSRAARPACGRCLRRPSAPPRADAAAETRDLGALLQHLDRRRRSRATSSSVVLVPMSMVAMRGSSPHSIAIAQPRAQRKPSHDIATSAATPADMTPLCIAAHSCTLPLRASRSNRPCAP